MMENTHRTNAYFLASAVELTKVVVNKIERVYREVMAAEVEGDVEVLAARNDPPLVGGVIVSTLDSSVDSV